MFDNDERSLRLPKHEQQREYNDQDHPSLSSVAPSELKICFNEPNPGLAPWAMKKYRPLGAHY